MFANSGRRIYLAYDHEALKRDNGTGSFALFLVDPHNIPGSKWECLKLEKYEFNAHANGYRISMHISIRDDGSVEKLSGALSGGDASYSVSFDAWVDREFRVTDSVRFRTQNMR